MKITDNDHPILDVGCWIADLLYRFALSFFIKLIRRRRTLNPKSKIRNSKFIKITVRSLFKINLTKESSIFANPGAS